MKVWYYFCLIFLLYSISILINERYEVTYQLESNNNSEIYQYLNCFNLSPIFKNRSEINLSNITNDLNYYFNELIENQDSLFNDYEKVNGELIYQLIKDKSYLIFKHKFCLILNDQSLLESIIFKQIKQSYFLYSSKIYELFEFRSALSEFHEIIVNHKGPPYSKCKPINRFKCLYDCIKKIQKLSKYYYTGNELVNIKLNYNPNDKSIVDNEIYCSSKCTDINCRIIYIYVNLDFKDKGSISILKAYPYISNLNVLIQLIGLICLFISISVYQLISRLIKFIKIKIKLRKYLNFKFILCLICSICFLILYIHLILDYIDRRDNPSFKKLTVFIFKLDFSIVICIPIYNILGNEYDIRNKTLIDLENDTKNGFKSTINDIYLEFLNRKSLIRWELKNKVLFKNTSRCFQVDLFPVEPKYRSIFAITKLTIEFKKYKPTIYLLTEIENFNSESFLYDDKFNILKRVIQRSKLNSKSECFDYEEFDDECTSKINCIDRCMHREFINEFKNITIDQNTIIDKDFFSANEWSKSYLNFSINLKNRKLNLCKQKFKYEYDCYSSKFERKSNTNNLGGNKISVDLYYDERDFKEEEPSIFKLLLDLLNIQSILFGLNALKLFNNILLLFKINSNKFIKFFIFLLCTIGLIAHLWFIFDEIINGQLIDSQFYEMASTFQMPVLIFCFDFNRTKLDLNHKLTYKYLNELTNDLNENVIFSKIEYLNRTNSWIKLDNRTGFNNSEFGIDFYYFLDKKCFKLKQNIQYKRNQFYFADSCDNVLRISFNKMFTSDKTIHFFSKTRFKLEFSKMDYLNIEFNNSKTFVIDQEIIKSDKFNLIKNPLSFNNDNNQNDVHIYLSGLMTDFKRNFNLSTFKLPYKKDDNLEIDDQLFDQYYNELIINSDQTDNDLKYQKKFVTNYLTSTNQIHDADFMFNLIKFKKVIVVTNEVNKAKLIINLLNALSLWFNLSVLDLYSFVYKIKFSFIKICKLLLKIECFLNNKI